MRCEKCSNLYPRLKVKLYVGDMKVHAEGNEEKQTVQTFVGKLKEVIQKEGMFDTGRQ